MLWVNDLVLNKVATLQKQKNPTLKCHFLKDLCFSSTMTAGVEREFVTETARRTECMPEILGEMP